MPQITAKKSAHRCDAPERIKYIDRIMDREVNTFYRESGKALSSDSMDSSAHNSMRYDSDYQTSLEDIKHDRHKHQNSHDEIANQLSKLKIGYNKNLKSDSGTVQDVTSEDDLKSHSILAGNSPVDSLFQNTIQSLPDARYSIILAGRLDSKNELLSSPDEHSLLNIAINESVETNIEHQSHYVDSLEVQREEISSSGLNEKNPIQTRIYCIESNSGNLKVQDVLSNDYENIDPNLAEPIKCGQPRIISDEMVKLSIKKLKAPTMKPLGTASKGKDVISDPILQYENNVAEDSKLSDRTENRFTTFYTESERLVTADVKTPNVKGILFIEDCRKSSPKIGVNVDTFGTDFITDISNLSTLVNGYDELNGNNAETDQCREDIFDRFSERFAEDPMKFTEKLLNLFEESVFNLSKYEKLHHSDVSLSRLTEEFRKMCKVRGSAETSKRIEDESMPDLGLGPLCNISTLPASGCTNAMCEDAAISPFHNFTKLGGGKKVYRKTPKRILKKNCTTPNCVNTLHKAKNNNLYLPSYHSNDRDYDSTATFEFWENLCYEMSPTKHASSKSLHIESSGVLTHEDLVRKSDQQMASLDESSDVVLNADGDKQSDSCKSSLAPTLEDHHEYGNSMRQKFIENLSSSLVNGNDKQSGNITDPKQQHNYNEIEQILASCIVKKRRKCFEEAFKAHESKQNERFSHKNESPKKPDYDPIFVNTISACMEYHDHIKTLQNHRNSLQCILECSEEAEPSAKENTNDSKSMEIVEALILPAQNRAKFIIENPIFSSKGINLIAQTSLHIPGTPGTSQGTTHSRSPRQYSRRSPIRRHSPGAQPASVLSKKIKSPVSPSRRSLRAVKPASHAIVPQTPSITPERCISKNKRSSASCRSETKSTPHLGFSNKLKQSANSPGLVDVTNTKKRFEVPKVTVTNPSPSSDSQKKFGRFKMVNDNPEVDCQRKLQFSETNTPQFRKNKYFFTPEKTPTYGKVKPKKMYFETPKVKTFQNKFPTSPGSYRINYNTVQSPIAMYIRGTDPNLITNVKGKTNERMLTPRKKTPQSKSKVSSPILARSPCMSPKSSETSRLKFQLTPVRRLKQKQEPDFLNIAHCESDPSSNIGSESTSDLPFPKVFYKPAPCVRMVNDNSPRSWCSKVLVGGTKEKIVYRHEGRLKSATESKVIKIPVDVSTTDSPSCDSGDISLLHQRPAAKSNYLFKK